MSGENTKHIGHCPEYSLFIFDCIRLKVADNLDRNKILYEYKFRQDRIIHFGVTCPWVPKKKKKEKKMIDLCVLNFYPIFMKLLDK